MGTLAPDGPVKTGDDRARYTLGCLPVVRHDCR